MSTQDASRPEGRPEGRPDGIAPSRRWTRHMVLSPYFQRGALAVVLSFILASLMIDYARAPGAGLRVGDVAEHDVRATKSFEFVDEDATRLRRGQAERAVHPVFELDERVASATIARVKAAFGLGRSWIEEVENAPPAQKSGPSTPQQPPVEDRSVPSEPAVPPASPEKSPSEASEPAPALPETSGAPTATGVKLLLDPKRREAMSEALGAELSESLYRQLLPLRFETVIEDVVVELMGQALAAPIIAERSTISEGALVNGITLLRVSDSGRSETVIYSRDPLLELDAAIRLLGKTTRERLAGRPQSQVDALVGLTALLLQPTVSYNASFTLERQREAANAVPDVKLLVKKGTMIVRRGDPIDEHKFLILRSIMQLKADFSAVNMLLAVALLVFVLISTTYVFAATYIRKFTHSIQDLITVSIILVFVMALARVSVEIANALANYIPVIPLSAYYYAVPLASGAMVVRILMNSETALLFSMIVASLAAMLLEFNGFYLAFYFISSLAAAGGIAHTKERVHVLRGGMVAGATNVATVLAIHLIHTNMIDAQATGTNEALALELGLAFMGGLAASVFTLGVVPFFEMFGYVTDYKLLELANLNHPLLKDLMLRAPGTYHHSVIVGNLSEAAAQAIRANALLARVGCLYHDIGKMKKPEYFIENLRNVSENRHDHMSAHMSALIIASHVRDGIEMARQHRLPQAIIDIIPGHHGTSLISFFYNKARQEAGSGEPVNENDFRYPGPKPRSREAGIVMLADATEASTRSIKNVNLAKIRVNLQKIFQRVINDGQLDECPLTLKELAVILATFQKTLEGIYHNRIEYPPEVRSGAAMAGLGTGAVLTLENDGFNSNSSVTASHVLPAYGAPVVPRAPRASELAATTTVDPLPMPQTPPSTGAVVPAQPGVSPTGATPSVVTGAPVPPAPPTREQS